MIQETLLFYNTRNQGKYRQVVWSNVDKLFGELRELIQQKIEKKNSGNTPIEKPRATNKKELGDEAKMRWQFNGIDSFGFRGVLETRKLPMVTQVAGAHFSRFRYMGP